MLCQILKPTLLVMLSFISFIQYADGKYLYHDENYFFYYEDFCPEQFPMELVAVNLSEYEAVTLILNENADYIHEILFDTPDIVYLVEHVGHTMRLVEKFDLKTGKLLGSWFGTRFLLEDGILYYLDGGQIKDMNGRVYFTADESLADCEFLGFTIEDGYIILRMLNLETDENLEMIIPMEGK